MIPVGSFLLKIFYKPQLVPCEVCISLTAVVLTLKYYLSSQNWNSSCSNERDGTTSGEFESYHTFFSSLTLSSLTTTKPYIL